MINISDVRNLVTSYEVSLPVTDPYECIWYDGPYVYTGGQNGAYILATNDSGQTSNRAPVLAAIGNKTVGAGSPLIFTVNAIDPDSNSLTYSAANLPANATFNPATRTFAWTPTAAQAGTYTVTFKVTDGSLQDIETVKIAVTSVSGISGPTTPSIRVTTPNGGQTWRRGSTQTITWDYSGSPGSTVKIVLLKAGVNVGTITDSSPIGSGGKGSYSWPISLSGSGGTGSDYKISVQSISQSTIKDTSDNYFTLASGTSPSSITVTSPNGGKSWVPGSTTQSPGHNP
jgi:hypothetical protein